jgi:hypothetical protein
MPMITMYNLSIELAIVCLSVKTDSDSDKENANPER